MTVEELKDYARKVGVPERVFKEMFAPILKDNRNLDEYETIIAKAECDRQADYWRWFKGVLERNKSEREQRKKEKGE